MNKETACINLLNLNFFPIHITGYIKSRENGTSYKTTAYMFKCTHKDSFKGIDKLFLYDSPVFFLKKGEIGSQLCTT